MTFIQVIDCRTHQAEEVDRLMDDWVRATQGKRTATHSVVARDRSDPDHVVEIVEFPSYEEAMRNSHLPETDRIFHRLVKACDQEPTFTDLEVSRDEQLNAGVARTFIEEVINGRNLDVADGLCTDDYREHDPSLSSYEVRLAQAKEENQEILEAFQPVLVIEDLFAEGDRVCARLSYTGRHSGAYRGLEPTGKKITGTGHATFRFEDGKIAESWWNTDDLGLLRQVGAVGF